MRQARFGEGAPEQGDIVCVVFSNKDGQWDCWDHALIHARRRANATWESPSEMNGLLASVNSCELSWVFATNWQLPKDRDVLRTVTLALTQV